MKNTEILKRQTTKVKKKKARILVRHFSTEGKCMKRTDQDCNEIHFPPIKNSSYDGEDRISLHPVRGSTN